MAVAWCSYFHDIANKIAWHDFWQIGGTDNIVEIDETHLFKRKLNVGHLPMCEHMWLFGGVSRATRKRVGVVVDDRTRGTLLPLMQQYINSNLMISVTSGEPIGDAAKYLVATGL